MPQEPEAWRGSPPSPGGPDEDWRLAACRGGVRLEPEAFRRAVEDHTNEASVLELAAKLAASGRRVVARRPPDGGGVPIASPGAPEATQKRGFPREVYATRPQADRLEHVAAARSSLPTAPRRSRC